MSRTSTLFALALAPAALLAGAAPALAQADGDKVNQLIVYGDDPCPQSSEAEITVCARKGESERYRIPEVLRGDPLSPKNEAWTDRVEAYEACTLNESAPDDYTVSQLLRAEADPLFAFELMGGTIEPNEEGNSSPGFIPPQTSLISSPIVMLPTSIS